MAFFWAGMSFQVLCIATVLTAFWVYQKRLVALRQAAGPRWIYRELNLIFGVCVLFTVCVVAAMLRV